MKIISWNVNGIRAAQGKGFRETLARLDADCVLLQETKAQTDQIDSALVGIDGYHVFSNCAERKGYSGVSLMLKEPPLSVIHGMGIDEHDREGRVIVAEYAKFYLLNVYTPNSGEELARLDYRKTWDVAFKDYCRSLQDKKPVILGGDFNVAHQEIDIARPKANYNKSSGYTQAEIDGFTSLLGAGFVDTFRHFNPSTVTYSWWSFRANARAKNIGWRIDYILTSRPLIDHVKQAFILPEVMGSDHCPVGVTIDI